MGWPLDLPESVAETFERCGLRRFGSVVLFPRCPASYVTAFTELMLEHFFFLRTWNKGPFELHPGWDGPLDPRFWPAMQVLQCELVRIEKEELDAIRDRGGS